MPDLYFKVYKYILLKKDPTFFLLIPHARNRSKVGRAL